MNAKKQQKKKIYTANLFVSISRSNTGTCDAIFNFVELSLQPAQITWSIVHMRALIVCIILGNSDKNAKVSMIWYVDS